MIYYTIAEEHVPLRDFRELFGEAMVAGARVTSWAVEAPGVSWLWWC